MQSGYLTNHWHATIEGTPAKAKTDKSFFVLNNEGILAPGEKFYFRVYFEPQTDEHLTATLSIRVDGNHRVMQVLLKGIGMEPLLEVIEEKITFDSTIPYSNNNQKFVIIRNASKFPVEYYFPDFDS